MAYTSTISKIEVTFRNGNILTVPGYHVSHTAFNVDSVMLMVELDREFDKLESSINELFGIANNLNLNDKYTDEVAYVKCISCTKTTATKCLKAFEEADKSYFKPVDDNKHLYAAIAERKLTELMEMDHEDRVKSDILYRLVNLLMCVNNDSGLTMVGFVNNVDYHIGPCVSVTACADVNRELLSRDGGYDLSHTYFE